MKKYMLLLFTLFLLISCGKKFKVEPDKYPNIPTFPDFENDVLKLHKIEEVIFTTDHSVSDVETRYLVKDSILAMINFTTDKRNQNDPQKNDKYLVNLTVINKGKITNHEIFDDDFKLNFQIDSANNITIGKYKYLSKANYNKADSIPNLKKEDWVDPSGTFEYKDQIFYHPNNFESIVIASNTKIDGAQNSPFLFLKDAPVYMNYYKVKANNKVGLTKVYNGYLPKIVAAD